MSTLKTKWGKRMAVVMAIALTVASVPGADAQAAKKAKLSTKKLTVKVGKKKTIKIKNKVKKAKYTFKVKKASIAKVSKKGVVTGKKAGSTTVTVKEKKGKKTRKVGTVKVTVTKTTSKKTTTPTLAPSATAAPTTAATATPTAPAQGGGASDPTKAPDPTTPADPTEVPGTPGPTKTPKPTPTVKPQPTADAYVPAGKGWMKLDLSTWSGGSDNYLETGGQIVLSEVELETVPIPKTLDAVGDKIEVLVRGSVPEGSDGFRYWVANDNGGTLTTMGHYSNFGEGVEDPRNADDPKADLDTTAFKAGQFQVQRILEHINKDNVADDQLTGTRLLLKGPSYGTTLDGIIITGIWVRYGENIGNADVETPGIESPGVESPGADTSATEEGKSYTVDFTKGYRADSAENDVAPTVKDGVITADFTGGYKGFHYVLPNEEDMKAANFKYVTVTYKNPGAALSFYLYDGETDLENPDISRESKNKQKDTEAGSLEKTDTEKSATFSWDGKTIRGFQVFSFDNTTKLEITSIVFSEKEPGTEAPKPTETPIPKVDTDVELTKANSTAIGALAADGSADASWGQDVADENEDGSITFHSSDVYSGGGRAFTFDPAKWSDYSKVEITLSAKQADCPLVLMCRKGETDGAAGYVTTGEAEKDAKFEVALEEGATAIVVKYNGWKGDDKEDTRTLKEKQKTRGDITVKSIKFVK